MTGRILVVDDLLPNVKLLEVKLEQEYYEVITAYDGFQALKILQSEEIDIVLLDVMMPGKDGFETCQEIKCDPDLMHIPIVMVTALNDIQDRVKGLESGADDFITKPIDDLALFARIRSLLRMKMMTDQLLTQYKSNAEMMGNKNDIILATDTSRAKITLIDTDQLQIDSIKSYLANMHHEITIITDTATILDVIDINCETIILGMNLDDQDGLRICSQIRGKPELRHIPILMLADEEDKDKLLKSLEVGANDYIIMPADKNEVIARTNTSIRKKRYHNLLKTDLEETVHMAHIDPLTKAYNRRYFETHYTHLFAEAKAQKEDLVLILLDIDRFKQVNDIHGHQVGDMILCGLVKIIKTFIRTYDFAARFGGEEFVIVMPKINLEIGKKIAERILAGITSHPFETKTAAKSLYITASIGLSSIDHTPNETTDILLKRIDAAAYEAKHTGRNRIVVAPRPSSLPPSS